LLCGSGHNHFSDRLGDYVTTFYCHRYGSQEAAESRTRGIHKTVDRKDYASVFSGEVRHLDGYLIPDLGVKASQGAEHRGAQEEAINGDHVETDSDSIKGRHFTESGMCQDLFYCEEWFACGPQFRIRRRRC